MKWNEAGRGLKVLGVSLAVGLGMTACSRDYTVAYVYATSATKSPDGEIDAYAVDYQTGAISQLPDSPIPDNGENPVAIAATPSGAPSGQNLYVVNQQSSNIEWLKIGTDGKLYGGATYNIVQNSGATIVGTNPTAVSIDPTGNFLYVTFTYQNGFTPARPGPGGFAVYPITSTGALGSPVMNGSLPYFPVGNNPVGIFVSTNEYVYVIDDEPSGSSTTGVMLVYKASSSTPTANPTITQVAGSYSAGSSTGGFAAGTKPAGIVVDPTGSYIYVTDSATNQLYAYSNGVGGVPTALRSSPYATGSDPLGLTIDPRGLYLYVTNFGSNTISAFALNTSNGSLSGVAGTGVTTDTGPQAVTIEPALGIYLFTANNTDSTITAEQLSANTGGLTAVQGTPFPAQALPTAIVAVANGAHATQVVDK